MTLNWKAIAEKWQKKWGEAKVFEIDPQATTKKLFITVAYPYPNSPQHVGHGRTFTLTDAYARFKRMQGYNVLFPMAFHYTGTPVLAISKRIAAGDKELIDDFVNVYKVPSAILKTFTEPLKIANYFHQEIKEGMKEIGYSIDWRREFTTIDPSYSRFIEWQFKKLQSKGLITRGSHPVGWCVNCGNPMGQHDTKGDVEPEIGELILIKFKYGNAYLPTGTLRPETVFGVTNLWMRPDLNYAEIDIEGETWIVSKECADKLVLLERRVTVIRQINGNELIGKYVENPVTGKEIPILPAFFVDPKNATGVVMSVPAHAPYDYIALKDLKTNDRIYADFALTPQIISEITPISVISLEGFSEFPAVDAISRLQIKGQMDLKVEEATKEVYSQEFRNGSMKENTGKYAKLSVSEAREKIKEELLQTAKAEVMYELLNRPVYCRCGAEVVVKIFKDQWFINYGDKGWKTLAHSCLDHMKIFPEDLRAEFKNVIDWLREKACARKQGLGTKLPWDPQWIIESLSDSVIYMSYYAISKHITEHKLNAANLDESVFDYIFLGVGNPKVIGAEKSLDPTVLREMRNEFTYFYPLDSRHSGRDLVPNHLTYFIFNHVALFPTSMWPKQIVVNGSVLMDGKKMSKSFGNIIPLRNALKSYGADPFRVAVLATAELLQDADFSSSLAKALKTRLERFHAFASQIIDHGRHASEKPLTIIDIWLLSQLQLRINAVTDALENMRFREAIHNALYMFDQDIQWYLKRSVSNHGDTRSYSILYKALKVRTLLLTPFAPHLCEEIWETMGHHSFISTSPWPRYEETQINREVLVGEELVKLLMDDVSHIIQVTKTTPQRIFFYTASAWKWQIYLHILELASKGTVQFGEVMRMLMNDPDLQNYVRKHSPFVQKIVRAVNKMSENLIKNRLDTGVINETKIITDALSFYENEYRAEICVTVEDDTASYDPQDRAKLAEPYRPAIYLD